MRVEYLRREYLPNTIVTSNGTNFDLVALPREHSEQKNGGTMNIVRKEWKHKCAQYSWEMASTIVSTGRGRTECKKKKIDCPQIMGSGVSCEELVGIRRATEGVYACVCQAK